MQCEDKLKILIEQLDISQQLHHTEFLKVARYEKVLCALLNIVADQEQDGLVDMIIDALNGFELETRYQGDVLEGINILGQFQLDK